MTRWLRWLGRWLSGWAAAQARSGGKVPPEPPPFSLRKKEGSGELTPLAGAGGSPRAQRLLSPEARRALHPYGRCGYADLLLAYHDGGPDALAATAGLLGYLPTKSKPPEPPPPPPLPAPEPPPPPEPEGPPQIVRRPLIDPPFWRLERFVWLGEKDAPPPPPQVAVEPTLAKTRPDVTALCRWSALVPRLRSDFTRLAEGRAPDIAAMIRRIGKGRMLDRLPRVRRLRWGPAVQIIIDRADRLTPFGADQNRVAARLAALFPRHAVTLALAFDGLAEPLLAGPDGRYLDYQLPGPGTLVVVLGDLGCLAGTKAPVAAGWAALGRRLAAAGCRPVALVPCPQARWAPECRRAWRMLAWERQRDGARHTPAELATRAERLLRLLAPANRIEPGLLRDVRLLLGADADAGTEADVWQHRALTGRSRVAATLDPQLAKPWREDLAARPEPTDLHVQVVQHLHRWRAGLAPEVWYGELRNLDPALRSRLPEPLRTQDWEAARRFYIDHAPKLEHLPGGPAWYRRERERSSPAYDAHDDPALRAADSQMFAAVYRDTPDARPPPGFDPSDVPPPPGAPERPVFLRQIGNTLVAADPARQAGAPDTGSPLGTLRTVNGLIVIDGAGGGTPADSPPAADRPHGTLIRLTDGSASAAAGRLPAAASLSLRTDRAQGTFGRLTRPRWAEAIGRDRFGLWARIAIPAAKGKPVTQRLRWIPPGRFLMGSPADEPGRFDDEGPQHPVTLTQGYWLFDTACTQAVWQAVMKENPSHFKSPDRPVESVSFNDVQKFISRINKLIRGLALTLPTEAQWEYACRADTTSALYTGPITILGERNAPELDVIAWYGGNSGVGFDLDNGYDSSDWEEKQFAHQKAGTRPVGQKQPNPWGLYDMLGNVWEWCLDGWRDNYREDAEADPCGPLVAGARRVVRGGSWNYDARDVRAAVRIRYHPDYRSYSLGFRCARVQDEPGK